MTWTSDGASAPLQAAPQRPRHVRQRLVHAGLVAGRGARAGVVHQAAGVAEQGAAPEPLLQRAHAGVPEDLLDRRQPAAQVGVRAHREELYRASPRALFSAAAMGRERAKTFADRLPPLVPREEADISHLSDEMADILYPGPPAAAVPDGRELRGVRRPGPRARGRAGPALSGLPRDGRRRPRRAPRRLRRRGGRQRCTSCSRSWASVPAPRCWWTGGRCPTRARSGCRCSGSSSGDQS